MIAGAGLNNGGAMVSYRAPRDVNMMEGIQAFLLKWRSQDVPGNHETVAFSCSAYGNINDSGSPSCLNGPSLTPHHSKFELSLEPGVRALVLLLVRRYGLVTYTSCEGHCYRGLDRTPTERHVGVLPRSATERTRVERLFVTLATTVNSRHGANPAIVELMVHHIADRKVSIPAVDLYFSRRASARWDDYFNGLQSLYDETLRFLASEHRAAT